VRRAVGQLTPDESLGTDGFTRQDVDPARERRARFTPAVVLKIRGF
jgi:hypothetical protein